MFGSWIFWEMVRWQVGWDLKSRSIRWLVGLMKWIQSLVLESRACIISIESAWYDVVLVLLYCDEWLWWCMNWIIEKRILWNNGLTDLLYCWDIRFRFLILILLWKLFTPLPYFFRYWSATPGRELSYSCHTESMRLCLTGQSKYIYV